MIQLHEIAYKNFQSVGNHPMKIQLDRSLSTVIGGQNGSGKTTLNYALTYNLFGKMLSGLKISGAINTTNKKGMYTHTRFTKHGNTYEVIRGEKPKKFEVYKNGEMLDQRANARDMQKMLELIIGMDFKLWCQIVVLNKERFVPFMDMGAADRRKVVEDILDISIFSDMNDELKSQLKEAKDTESDLDHEVQLLRRDVEGKKALVTQIKQQLEEAQDETAEEIKSHTDEIELLEQQIDSLLSEIEDLDEQRMNKLRKDLKEYDSIAVDFSAQRKRIKQDLEFFKDNDSCPTCEQLIDESLREQKSEATKYRLKEIDDAVEEMMQYVAAASEEFEKLDKVATRREYIKHQVEQLRYKIQTHTQEIKRIETRSKTRSEKSSLEKAISDQHDVENALETKIERLREVMIDREVLEDMKHILGDQGIKAQIVSEYISLINKKINEYLISMEFYIGMTLDENFNESFSAMHKESFVLDNLSTGQRARVNLAIWLALLEVAAIKNSVVTNVLFLDEVLENLDAEGVQAFMRLANDKLKDKNLFVVTQRFDEFQDYFQSAIRFKLNSGFTEIVN